MIDGGSVSLSAFDNHIWNAITSGTFTNGGPGPEVVSGIFGSGSDVLYFTATGAPDYGAEEVCEWSGTVSGSIVSITPNIIIYGPMSGTYTYTGEGEGYGAGTFEGSGSGEWHTEPPPP